RKLALPERSPPPTGNGFSPDLVVLSRDPSHMAKSWFEALTRGGNVCAIRPNDHRRSTRTLSSCDSVRVSPHTPGSSGPIHTDVRRSPAPGDPPSDVPPH